MLLVRISCTEYTQCITAHKFYKWMHDSRTMKVITFSDYVASAGAADM